MRSLPGLGDECARAGNDAAEAAQRFSESPTNNQADAAGFIELVDPTPKPELIEQTTA